MSSLDYKEDARDLHAFKELRFFLSHQVPLEIRCSVSRLELPLVADYLLGSEVPGSSRGYTGDDHHGSGRKEQQRGDYAESDGVAAMTALVRRVVSEPELVATCQLFSDGQPMHKVAMSSHTPSRYDPRQHAIVWDDSMCFPVRYRDLDRNSQLVVVLRGVKDRLVGVASMRLFDANGSLRMGLQKRPFLFTDKVPFSWDPAAPPSGRQPGEEGVWCDIGGNGSKGGGGGHEDDGNDGNLSKEDWGFALERMREKYRLRTMDRADWLDPVSLSRVDRLVAALADPAELRRHRAYQTDAEAGLRDSPNLVLEMPCFAHPIIHEERPYSGVPGGGGAGGGGSGSAVMIGAVGAAQQVQAVTPAPTPAAAADGEAPGGMGEGGRSWGDSDLLAGGGSGAFLLVSDFEMEEDNPVEHKYRKLAHDQLRGLVDPELKPNRDERHRIDDLVAGRQDHLAMEEKDLLWKFRYCLTDNKRALTKLLLSVDWGVDSEVAQVDGLLAEWARRAPIDAPDALKLLGRERTFQAEVVRRFAVDALRRASDDELLTFLLQLVQALRYQQVAGGGGGGAGPGGASDGGAAASAAAAGGEEPSVDGSGGGSGGVSPLAQFLIERACRSLKLANFFYWYLRVELEDATHGHIYRGVQAAFQRAMSRGPESARVLDMLLAQDHYVQAVAEAHQEACDLNGRKWAKDERLRELLKAPHLRRVPKRSKGGGGSGGVGGVAEGLLAEITGGGGGGESVPMPLDPTVQITGLEPASAFLFKSALYPCVIEFTVKRDRERDRDTTSSGVTVKTGAVGTAVRTLSSETASGTASTAAAGGESERGGEGGVDGQGKDGNTMAAAVGTVGEVGVGGGDGASGAVEGGTSSSSSSWLGQAKPKETSYKVIFKSGDDLRQDQLIMQMISLMDSLLKRVNLDLRLKPYGILATGPRTGLVEFVSGSQPVSAVLSAHNGSILEYLRHHNPDPSAPNGVRPAAVQTFVKSTAGYCVITYLLGIGDRHLDNIMMLPTGNLFHIDFGYIFGRDPKPGATPIRLTREMAEAMGGVNSEDYRLFKTYCCQAFNWLRKSANLILNLLSLMSDAGISDLSDDPVAALAKVEDNFRLDLTDEMAENLFLRLIDTSLQAVAPRVLELLHRVRVAGR